MRYEVPRRWQPRRLHLFTTHPDKQNTYSIFFFSNLALVSVHRFLSMARALIGILARAAGVHADCTWGLELERDRFEYR
jgi:hypothetical protein